MSGTAQPQPWHRMEIGEGDSGPTFVWLHGWGQTLGSLERIAQLFKADGRHILFDQPGFGQTPPPPSGAGSADYADMLASELTRLGVGPCIFIGHSFGARVSVQMAARHPALVAAIVLVAGAGLRRRKTFKAKVRSFFIRLVGNLARLSDDILGTSLRDRHRERFGSPDYKNAGVLRPTLVSVVNENLVAEARAARCPALLVYGSDDTETPPEIGRRYEAALPIARYVELAGFGHLDILSRGAWQVEAAMRAFLTDLKKGDSL
ncbi:alpha/beta fold hydrolase [Gimibacter soli]|uniref:Alpha/beta hydrolase n=1 Tax=Gimibacter soli TaxID=3024400 RepID=A0AAF0BMG6_9PROT|nr:alpha/beta hydrolase [Gimibacter soli]WCL54540.1 alpha/beta hydrolase [Gimibacter soli]